MARTKSKNWQTLQNNAAKPWTGGLSAGPLDHTSSRSRNCRTAGRPLRGHSSAHDATPTTKSRYGTGWHLSSQSGGRGCWCTAARRRGRRIAIPRSLCASAFVEVSCRLRHLFCTAGTDNHERSSRASASRRASPRPAVIGSCDCARAFQWIRGTHNNER